MDAILAEIDEHLRWVPSWLVGLGLVALAVMFALTVHRVGKLIIRRVVGTDRPITIQLLERISGPVRLALCLASVAFVLPFAPLEDPLRSDLSHGFAVAVIGLIGWISMRAVEIAADEDSATAGIAGRINPRAVKQADFVA